MIYKLLKKLLNKNNQEEEQALHSWRDDIQANLDGLRKLTEEKGTYSELQGYREVDRRKAWDNIRSRTQSKGEVRWMPILTRAAAVMALVIAAWFGLDYINQSSTDANVDQIVHNATNDQEVILNDQTKIQLKANSFLSKIDNRHVSLDGRAYFDVAKDPANPFVIDLHHGKITVLGTAFDIVTHKDYTQVYVTEGKVRFNFNDEEIILTADDMIYVTKDGIQKTTQANVQIEAWQTKKLVFSNESLVNVLYSVASLHQKQLVLETSASQLSDQCKINTTYTTETLTEILEELKSIAGLDFVIENNKIVIKSFKC